MQNDPLSHGLWETTAPPAPPTEPLAGHVKADVAVVGCGYTGLSAALRLAEAGAKVVALEAVEIGFGGAGRNVGLVNAGMWVMPSELPEGARRRLRRTCADAARRRSGRGLGDDREARDRLRAGAQRHAALRGRRAGARRDSRSARSNGARAARRCASLSAAETAKRTGADGVTPARFSTCARAPSSRSLTRAASRARRSAPGAAIHTQSPVRAAERTGGKWTLTDGSRERRRRLGRGRDRRLWRRAVAAGTARADPPALLQFRHRRRSSAELQASILPGREGCWDTQDDPQLLPLRSRRAARVRQRRARCAERGSRSIAPGRSARCGSSFRASARSNSSTQWYGMIGMTDDALPRFHRLAENVVTFCGYNGRGIGPGTVFGRVLADHILGRIAKRTCRCRSPTPDAPRCRRCGRPITRPARRSRMRPADGCEWPEMRRKSESHDIHHFPPLTGIIDVGRRLWLAFLPMRADETFRTDSGGGVCAPSLDYTCTTGRFYGYGNRQMVQRD